MLTLPQIKSAVLKEANGHRITRANYAELADRVIPRVDILIFLARADNEETRIYRKAQLLEAEGWLDLACIRVAINQMKKAAEVTR